MKLELKHLAGYLPYELNALCVRTNEIRKVTLLHFTYDLKTVGHNHLIYEGLLLEKHKPILCPLSDLTKEIEVNGEKFVPIEWFEIGDDVNDSEEYDHGNIKLIKTMESISKFNISNDMLHLPYGVVQKLYEWHFDIHGLIEAGLAIDINTLTK